MTRFRFIHSLRFKLAARFMGVFSFILFFLGFLAYYEFNSYQTQEFDRSLYNYAVDAAHAINVDVYGGVSFDVDSLIGNGKSFPFAIGHSFVQLIKLDGVIIGKSRDLGNQALPIGAAALKAVAKDHFYFQTVRSQEMSRVPHFSPMGYRQVNLLIGSAHLPNFVLQIAVPLAFLVQEREKFVQTYLIVIPFALLISLLGGFYLSRKAFIPIHLIIERARLFDPTKLDQRLPLPPTSDELFTLSLTLNNLLDRIQKVFNSQERFIADASHELKTPLTILRGELEIALKKPRSSEETQELMKSMAQELDFLTRVINNLLLLARVESGAAFLTRSPVRMDEVAMDAVARLERLASEKNVTIKPELRADEKANAQFIVHGDEDLLKSMVNEIVSNAIKYSPHSGVIRVLVRDNLENVEVDVTDDGPGVPQGSEIRIFERFYRASETDIPGSGLGLSIAQKIAEIHGGYIGYSKSPNLQSLFTIQIKKL